MQGTLEARHAETREHCGCTEVRAMYRVYPAGDVIALFPDELATMNPAHCQSYQHVGQHGAADPHLVISQTRPASRFQYAELDRELYRLGYNVTVIQRISRVCRLRRERALQAMLY